MRKGSLLIALLAAVLIYELAFWTPTVSPVTISDWQNSAQLTINVPVTLPPQSDFDSIVERPLFSAGRRKAKVPSVSATPPAAIERSKFPEPATSTASPVISHDPELRLIGISVTPPGRYVLVASSGGRDVQALTIGEAIDGWIIEAIHPRAIVLTRSGITKTIDYSPAAEEATTSPGSTTAEALSEPREQIRARIRQRVAARRGKLEPPSQ